MNIDETLSYIHAVCWRSSIPGLERIRALATYVQFGEMEKFVENMHAARFLPHTDASLYPSVKRRV